MENSIDNLKLQAQQGDVEAQVQLATAYRSGQGVEKDMCLAFEWFKKAAMSGHAHAQYNLAMRYFNGQGVERDFKHATLWFAKAADQGHVQALYALGFRYLNGDGVDKNRAVAMEIFEKVAQHGFAYAQYNLGKQHYDFLQYELAVTWLQKAVLQDYPQAMLLLATCYELGRGVSVDKEKASLLRNGANSLLAK